MAKPTIGDIVIYKSKIDNGEGNEVLSPAMVIRTRETTVAAVIDRWGPEPRTVTSKTNPKTSHETAARPEDFVAELPDDDTVDLIVFGLGKDYREYAVPRGDGLGQWQPHYPLLVAPPEAPFDPTDFVRREDLADAAYRPQLSPTGACEQCSCNDYRPDHPSLGADFCSECGHHVGIHQRLPR